MRKFLTICKGWFIFLFKKRSAMAKERLKICFECPKRFGIVCSMCGCELHAKSEIEEEECPLDKWVK
jgi:Family of unknown function (DUF6171)